MGKAKKKHKKPGKRHDPAVAGRLEHAGGSGTGVDADPTLDLKNEAHDGPSSAGSSDPILKLVQLAADDDPSRRELACAEAGMALQAGAAVTTALHEGADKVLVVLLGTDPSVGVRSEAAGAIRNMTASGNPAVSDRLLRANLMTAMTVQLPLVVQDALSLAEAGSTAKTDAQYTREREATLLLLEHLLHIFRNVGEDASEDVLNTASTAGLSAAVAECVAQASKLPGQVLLTAVQCLHTISEDNAGMVGVTGSAQFVGHLVRLLELPADGSVAAGAGPEAAVAAATTASLRVGVAGVLLNTPEAAAPEVFKAVFSALGGVLGVDTAAEMAGTAGLLPAAGRLKPGPLREPGPEWIKVDSLRNLLVAQQTALELVSNICYVGPDGGPGEAVGLPALQAAEIPGKVLLRCSELGLAAVQMCTGNAELGLPLLAAYTRVQARAIVCLGNMLALAGPADFEHGFVSVLWTTLFGLGSSPRMAEPSKQDCFEAVTGTMLSLARLVKEHPVLQPSLTLTAPQLEAFVVLATTAASQAVRANMLGLLAHVGQFAATAEFLAAIATVVAQSLSVDAGPWVLAEALNVAFDLFAEPEVNGIAVSADLFVKLEAVAPQLPGAIQDAMQAGIEEDIVGRLCEAAENLERFFEYKASQLS